MTNDPLCVSLPHNLIHDYGSGHCCIKGVQQFLLGNRYVIVTSLSNQGANPLALTPDDKD